MSMKVVMWQFMACDSATATIPCCGGWSYALVLLLLCSLECAPQAHMFGCWFSQVFNITGVPMRNISQLLDGPFDSSIFIVVPGHTWVLNLNVCTACGLMLAQWPVVTPFTVLQISCYVCGWIEAGALASRGGGQRHSAFWQKVHVNMLTPMFLSLGFFTPCRTSTLSAQIRRVTWQSRP